MANISNNLPSSQAWNGDMQAFMGLMSDNVSLFDDGGSLEDAGTEIIDLDVLAGIKPLTVKEVILATLYGLICLAGLLGNGLVIVVVLRYASMKTATNIYILNLSIADLLFLVGLPLIMTTALARGWVFGRLLCKAYMVLQCVNTFTGSLTLAVLSYDRYLAVCHPVTSRRYRTTRYAALAVLFTWLVSAIAIFPIVHYANVVSTNNSTLQVTCTTTWLRRHGAIFVAYNFLFSFFAPVLLICIFYALLIVRLRAIRKRTAHSRGGSQVTGRGAAAGAGGGGGSGVFPTRRRVTRMVTLIIAVYIACWLPYWTCQLYVVASGHFVLSEWLVDLIKASTVLSYANSMINPILYAFTNELFRQSFVSAFRCVPEAAGLGQGEGREAETGYARSKITTCEPLTSLHRPSACGGNIALEVVVAGNGCSIISSPPVPSPTARMGVAVRRVSLCPQTARWPSDVTSRRRSLGVPAHDVKVMYSPFGHAPSRCKVPAAGSN